MNKIAEIGGAEVSLLTLTQSIQKYNYRPVVVLGSDGPLHKRLNELKIRVFIYPLDFPHIRNPIPFLKSVFFLIRVIKREKVRLIHSNTLWDNQYGVLAAKLARIPHILHVRGFSERNSSWKSIYYMGSFAFCNSKHTKNAFLKYSKFRKRVEVVYNAVDIKKFKPDQRKRKEIRELYGFRNGDFVMGMAGRLAEEKGQLSLLKSLLPMLKRNPTYKILIAGDAKIHPDTKYTEQIASIIKNNSLERNVILTGFIEDMTSFYNALDLFLLPSYREPFGRVLVEAMATRVGIVASKVGGVPEVVDHEETGYLVDPKDADGWNESINKLTAEESLLNQLGEAGRRKVLEKFTLEHMESKVVSLYGELINVD